MARKTTTKRTAAERAEQAKALQSSIANQVEQLRDSEQWRRYLHFLQAFHSYSLGNVLLILAQCPHATRVAGFRKWQELGRQVRKGEKGLKIFGYSTKRLPAQESSTDAREEGDQGSTEEHVDDNGRRYVVRVRYPVLSVFDISQTDPIEGIEQVQEPVQLLTGEDTAEVVRIVTDWLISQGWAVSTEPIPGGANGYTTADGTRRVVIGDHLSPAAAAKTMLHEAAHVLLHAEAGHAQYIEHRGICETEAESVAYVVAGLLGVDTSAYSIGYIATWSEGDAEVIKTTAANVLRAAHTLADLFTTAADDAAAA